MLAGLFLAALTYTHTIFGWPLGTQPAPALPVSSTDAAPKTGAADGVPWVQLIEAIPLLAVGILYLLGRRSGVSPKSTSGLTIGSHESDKEQRDAPFYPHLKDVGRRLESALYGSARKTPTNPTSVKSKIEASVDT